jgi:CrcB protein
MKQALIVGLGGFIGSVSRFKISGMILHHSLSWRFPLPTFVINVFGCFLIGALTALMEQRDLFSTQTRLFLVTGLVGGFTTFSAFGYEGVYLLRRGETGISIAYVGLSVVCGFAALWLALKLFGLGAHH